MSKQVQLDDLKKQIVQQKVTPELAKTAKHLVFGEGSPDAKVVFVGEAPGKKEDETGRPFIGAAGRFLSELLESIGLKRQDVYITSILKYRPPNNRDPKPEEKTAFWPYLQAQLEIIAPKLVVTLGRHSSQCFLPDLQIGKAHGKPHTVRLKRQTGRSGASALLGASEKRTAPYGKYDKGASELATPQRAAKLGRAAGSAGGQNELVWTVLPLYHPAVALYNSSMRKLLIDDFAKIPKLM